MLKITSIFAALAASTVLLSGCETAKSMPKELINDAQPIYKECIADMKQKMTDEEARKICTDRLKSSMQKI